VQTLSNQKRLQEDCVS